MNAPVPAKLIIPFDRFPALHRTLWTKGMTERDRYGSRPYGATLSPYTERGARSGWGRFLATCPESERPAAPADLVTPLAIRRFIAEMKRAGNRDNTIANRVCQVRAALGIMCPDADFLWLTSPDGNNVRSLFQSERRPIRIYHPLLLYSWGLELMDKALRIDRPKRRAVQVPERAADCDPCRARAAPAFDRRRAAWNPHRPSR